MKNVHVIIVLLVFLLPLAGLAETKVDSLKRLLQSEVPIDRAEVSWMIAYELFDVDNPQALFYAERAYHDVWKGGDSLQIVKVGTTYGQLLRRAGRLSHSIEISTGLLRIARRHDYKKYKLMLLNSLTLSLTFKEEFGRALEFGFESLELRRIEGKSFDIAIGLNNLGILYYKLGDDENAIKWYKESERVGREVQETSFNFSVLHHIGLAYTHLGQPTIGMKYLDSAMAIRGNSSENLMALNYGFAYAYKQLGDTYSSEKYFTRCFELANKLRDSRFQLEGLNGLADLELRRGNISLCGKYLRDLDGIGNNTEHKLIRTEIIKTTAEYYAANGEMSKAYSEVQKYIREKFSQVLAMNRDVRKVQQREMEKENIRKLELQSNILVLQNQTLIRQRLFAISVTCLVVILGMVSYKLYLANGRIRTINRLLDERVVERTTELRQHSNLLQHTVDENRILSGRVASEISSLLSTLKGLFYLSKSGSDKDTQLCILKANSVVETIEQALLKLKR